MKVKSSQVKCECVIRASYRRFPSWSQPLWTLLTAKPLPGEQPLLRLRPLAMVAITLVLLCVAIATHLALLHAGSAVGWAGYWLTPLFTVVVVGALRKIQVVYVHHCAHKTMVRSDPALNRLLGDCFTTLALIQNLCEYREEHFEHHNRTIFTTSRDADAALLYRLGIRPGLPVRALWRALAWTLVSPSYHGHFLAARLRSNLIARSILWRLISITWLIVLVLVAPAIFGVSNVALAIWFPLTLAYQASALLQFLTEHVWLISEYAPEGADAYAQRCIGRFCGEILPSRSSLLVWAGWWLRTVLVHVPVRFGILVGDLPAHDWHHLCGFVRHHPAEWPRAIFARQQAIDEGVSMGMELREFWGLARMLDHVFLAMSNAPSIAESPSVLHQGEAASSC